MGQLEPCFATTVATTTVFTFSVWVQLPAENKIGKRGADD
jgi:hypothetical protein